MPRVASRAFLNDAHEQRIVVAIDFNFLNVLKMAARFAFRPERLPASGVVTSKLRFQSFLQAFFIHIRQHQHFAVFCIDRNARH